MAARVELPEGFLSEAEADALAALAKDRLVLEVGSWLGRSTVAMAQTARRVVSVDHHSGSAEHKSGMFRGISDPQSGEPSTLRRFLANLEAAGVREKVTAIVDAFENVAPLLRSDFELIFIDAAHDEEAVIRHGQLAARYCGRYSAMFAFHDYGVWAGVAAGVHHLAGRWHSKPAGITGTSIAMLKRS